jgi:hypothetical protein
MREIKAAQIERKAQAKINETVLARLQVLNTLRAAPRTAPRTGSGGRRQGQRQDVDDEATDALALPLDGSRTTFGVGFRGKVVAKIRPTVFKYLGAAGMRLPTSQVRCRARCLHTACPAPSDSLTSDVCKRARSLNSDAFQMPRRS